MKQFLIFLSVIVFSIFIGAQITEGVLLVPYWQSLSSSDFYTYYNQFGSSISQYYTTLTITAALIPLFFTIYLKLINSNAFKFSLISTFFAFLFVVSFYLYFKDANELFYQAALSDMELKDELITWGYWHWGRIVIEFVTLFFLIISFYTIQNRSNS